MISILSQYLQFPSQAGITRAAGLVILAMAPSGCATLGRETVALSESGWPEVRSPFVREPAIEARIAEIVGQMSLRQKIGQMTQPDIRSIKPDEVRQYYIGSVLNGGGAWPGGNKHASPADWRTLAAAYRQASLSTDLSTKIPVIWGTDAVHGHNNVFRTTLFPHNIGLGAARDPELIGRIAAVTARQVRATGIDWAFAPTLAVVQSPRWGRTYESYSSDPELVRSYASHFVRGMQGNLRGAGTAVATAKHFIGDGGTFTGIDQGETRTTIVDLIATHAPGYFGALEAGVQTVMISYSSWKDTGIGTTPGKMHGNRDLITGALKERMGFDGLVVSDWNGIEQVPGCTRTHCPQAINAGVDLIMVPDDWKAFIGETVADVEAGRIPMSRIDDAVTRILRVKMRAGLFDAPVVDPSTLEGSLNDTATRSLAREAVAKSLVLLKNARSGLLPLRRNARVFVVGEGADRFTSQLGGWSLTWQGDETDNADYPIGDTLLSALRSAVQAGGTVTYSRDGTGFDPSRFDVVIAALAERPYAEMKGDVRLPATLRHSDRYPADLAALKAVSGRGVPVVSILFSGRPVYANDLMNLSDAFIAAWLPGTEAGGIADVIFGKSMSGRPVLFNGRLPFAWPGNACPDTRASRALFERGYGLVAGTTGAATRLAEDRVASCPMLGD